MIEYHGTLRVSKGTATNKLTGKGMVNMTNNQTEMAKVMEKARVVAYTDSFTKEEHKMIKNILIPDGVMRTFCKGRGYSRMYMLTKKGKMIMGY